MKGTIVNFRQGRHHQYDSHMIIQAENVDSRDKTNALLGKDVIFKTEAGNEIKGTIKAAHGNKGAVRVIFEKGMPGQSFGKNVEIKA